MFRIPISQFLGATLWQTSGRLAIRLAVPALNILNYRCIVLLGVERFIYYDATNLDISISPLDFHFILFIFYAINVFLPLTFPHFMQDDQREWRKMCAI